MAKPHNTEPRQLDLLGMPMGANAQRLPSARPAESAKLWRPPTKLEANMIRAALLPTWQTAAAIAQHAGVPARTAVTVLKKQATDWQLETRLVRIDGHNEVHMFRQRRMVQMLGVMVPMGDEETEGEG